METNHNNIHMHERVTTLEANYKHIDERLDCIEVKLDKVRTQIAQWKGSFGVVSLIGGLIGGGVVTLVVWLITH
jgi:tetrahydromethanopterin S-methyltransferase subunit G